VQRKHIGLSFGCPAKPHHRPQCARLATSAMSNENNCSPAATSLTHPDMRAQSDGLHDDMHQDFETVAVLPRDHRVLDQRGYAKPIASGASARTDRWDRRAGGPACRRATAAHPAACLAGGAPSFSPNLSVHTTRIVKWSKRNRVVICYGS
jgi:hypothetical protein